MHDTRSRHVPHTTQGSKINEKDLARVKVRVMQAHSSKQNA